MLKPDNTIAAIATPPGRGGVGIIRISGKSAITIASKIAGFSKRNKSFKPRFAHYVNFYDLDDSMIDQGLILSFPGPNSFTGEDVVELQGHGGPVVMNMLLNRVIALGARIAKPGEFSERAFLNDKIDLSQAEAIADLIDSVSQQSVKSSVRSLQGEFSNWIKRLDQTVVEIRIFVEAAIDFPEEEIDFLSDDALMQKIELAKQQFETVLAKANEGALLRDGVSLVLAGRPNAGKSSLMNQLSGRESSIVTQVAGTTRDLVNEFIHLEGIPLKLIDTAGIRFGNEIVDEVEAEGIRRAKNEISGADGILVLVDLDQNLDWQSQVKTLLAELDDFEKVIVVLNKIDLISESEVTMPSDYEYPLVSISAKSGLNLEVLKQEIKQSLTLDLSEEGTFIARSRHIDALNRAFEHLNTGIAQLLEFHAGELMAEDLKLCHQALSEITGEFTPDELLGEIFSSFCIGK